MDCAVESKDAGEKCTSSAKKTNGVDCNGVDTDHQSDCDTAAREPKSLSNSPSHEVAAAKHSLSNGFSDTAVKEKEEDASNAEKGQDGSPAETGAAVPKDNLSPPKSENGEAIPTSGKGTETSEVQADPKPVAKKDDSVASNDVDMDCSEPKKDDTSADKSKDSSDVDMKEIKNEAKEETESINVEDGVGSGKSEKPSATSPKSALEKTSDSGEAVEKKSPKSKTEASDVNKSKHGNSPQVAGLVEGSDSTGDDIEIIGESIAPRPQSVVIPKQSLSTLPLQAGVLSGASPQNTLLLQNMKTPTAQLSLLGTSVAPRGSGNYVHPGGFGNSPAQGVSLLNTNSNAPPTPKSSMDQIELIRWEIQNRINVRPKYFKPNPSSELGPLAKFLFDIGSDLIKESVYHDLVKIQSKKNEDDKLTEKEKDDLSKLKEIEKDLHATIGHLKLRLRKKCQTCGFQTESNNVLFFHKQFPHEDNKNLRCSHCNFSTKQAMAYKFHMEAEHAMQGRLHEKKNFYECHMCPYENNQEQKVVLHRERCLKQFRPLFNLHPSCLSGAEINLCLENIFYKAVVPKNIKLLQQKHAQQQAALIEAKRQQAQMQMIAAQKNAAALMIKKQQQAFQAQQQLQKQRQLQALAPRANTPVNPRAPAFGPRGGVSPQQNVRYKGPRPTVANMLNNKALAAALPTQNTPPGGFEVCEICGGYVKDRKALRIHFFYAHRIDLPFNLFERNQAPLYCATCYVRFWTAQGLRKHIDTHKEENQTRGVVGKCISCSHNVLNLLLHMRVVHNRELQHYINALMCMFCGGHFSSRQECERHILKTHGHVDPVSGTLKAPPTGGQGASPQPTTPKSGSGQKKGKGNNLVKGSVCVLCNLNFGRNVDLTRHCMRMHHTCMKCGMVVIDKASLLKHTCLTSPSGTRDCGMCGETGFHPAYYVKHLRDKHLRKFSIKVAKVSKDVIERWTKRPCPFNDVQGDLVEVIDSDDESQVSSKGQNFTPAKKPKIGPACSKIKKPVKKARIGPASKIGRAPIGERKKVGDDSPDNSMGESDSVTDGVKKSSNKVEENHKEETLVNGESSVETDSSSSGHITRGEKRRLSTKESPENSEKRRKSDNE